MDNSPLITVGLTCFNAEDTMATAIEGALAQQYENKEIIIVDDCSSDNSKAVVRAAIKGHENIRFIEHRQNTGFAGALNTIIQNANGEFIAIFDDDDTSLPMRLQTQLNKILSYEKEHGTTMLACWTSGYKQYDNGYQAPFKAIGSEPKVPIGKDLIQCQLYMGRNPEVFFGCGTPSCSLMVRKSTYETVGLYDTTMRRTEDTDFALRLAKAGGHFIGCPEQLVIQSASVGHDKRPEVGYKSELALAEKHQDLFTPPRRYNYAQDWIKLRFHHFGQERVKSILQLIKLFVKYPTWTWDQFWRSAPNRMKHEKKMAQ
ncbi:MAG: glycosyl transferase [Micavibrio sp.]|nr:glycosyl transferase [Micavibrio sp.]|tara:strand:+ start:849 stop:1796 length:948 start_codon:yes stop_codon:yes gene_type:complete